MYHLLRAEDPCLHHAAEVRSFFSKAGSKCLRGPACFFCRCIYVRRNGIRAKTPAATQLSLLHLLCPRRLAGNREALLSKPGPRLIGQRIGSYLSVRRFVRPSKAGSKLDRCSGILSSAQLSWPSARSTVLNGFFLGGQTGRRWVSSHIWGRVLSGTP